MCGAKQDQRDALMKYCPCCGSDDVEKREWAAKDYSTETFDNCNNCKLTLRLPDGSPLALVDSPSYAFHVGIPQTKFMNSDRWPDNDHDEYVRAIKKHFDILYTRLYMCPACGDEAGVLLSSVECRNMLCRNYHRMILGWRLALLADSNQRMIMAWGQFDYIVKDLLNPNTIVHQFYVLREEEPRLAIYEFGGLGCYKECWERMKKEGGGGTDWEFFSERVTKLEDPAHSIFESEFLRHVALAQKMHKEQES